MIEVKEVNVFSSTGEQILKGINLYVSNGEIVTLIGNNGAGKSEILHLISGLLHPSDGQVLFQGKPIHKLKPYQISRLGIGHVMENRRIFSSLSVWDNLYLATFPRYLKVWPGLLRREVESILERFTLLRRKRNQMAGTLSGGEQQVLAIARALAGKPKLLLLDEPSLGLAPLMIKDIFHQISDLRNEGLTMLLVEQMATYALRISDRMYLLRSGEIVLKGTKEEAISNRTLIDFYLGVNPGNG